MFWTIWLWVAALFLSKANAANERVYADPDTKLNFYQTVQPYRLENGKGITFRYAIPDSPTTAVFDIVIQMVVPNEVGWAGLGWGGGMDYNPLLVVFRNGNNNGVLASSRWATGHITPQTYSQATYTVFKAGTKINSTHWQVTAKCTGCTSWTGRSGSKGTLKTRGESRFGWAYSLKKPSNPNSATSAIPVHDLGQYFSLDVTKGGNKDFAAAVAKLT